MNYYFLILVSSYIVLQLSAEPTHRFKPQCKYNEQDLIVKGSIGQQLAINVLPPAFDEVTLKSCQFDREYHYDNGYYDIDPTYNNLTHGTYAEKIIFTSLEEATSCSFIIRSLENTFFDRWIVKTRFDAVNKSKQKIFGEKEDRVEIINTNKPKEEL